MIDLRSPDATPREYAQRYADLLPERSPQLRQRMSDTLAPDAPRLPSIKPAWLRDRSCTLSPEQAPDRAQGALLGLAVGDSVGTTLEFQPRDQGHVSDMVGGGPFYLAPGEWTDDTSIALADTYANQGKFDYTTFADAMVRWYRQGENSVNGRCSTSAMSPAEPWKGGRPKGLHRWAISRP